MSAMLMVSGDPEQIHFFEWQAGLKSDKKLLRKEWRKVLLGSYYEQYKR